MSCQGFAQRHKTIGGHANPGRHRHGPSDLRPSLPRAVGAWALVGRHSAGDLGGRHPAAPGTPHASASDPRSGSRRTIGLTLCRWCLLADVLPPPRCCLRRLPRAVNGRATRRAAAKGDPGTMAEPRPNDRSGRQTSKIMLGFQGAQPVGRWRQPVPASCTVVLKGRFLWQPFSEDAKFERSEEP